MPLAAILLGGKGIPDRWWFVFGILSFLLLYPTVDELIQHGYGRRPFYISDDRYVRFVLLFLYFAIAPIVGAKIKRRWPDGGH